jgi:hypothetical protein
MGDRYRKERTYGTVGEPVELPGNATGITIGDPFAGTVLVSYLVPESGTDKGVSNHPTLYEHRAHYSDDSPVEIPSCAMAVTIHEPSDSTESIVYWLA